MCLETMKGVKFIAGQKIVVMDDLKETNPELFRPDGSMHYDKFEELIRPNNFIYVRYDKNSLSFTLQNGPTKENGINGCQVTDVLEVVKHIIENLNAKYPCRENDMTITKLDEALMWQLKRTQDRTDRGVEGKNEK